MKKNNKKLIKILYYAVALLIFVLICYLVWLFKVYPYQTFTNSEAIVMIIETLCKYYLIGFAPSLILTLILGSYLGATAFRSGEYTRKDAPLYLYRVYHISFYYFLYCWIAVLLYMYLEFTWWT